MSSVKTFLKGAMADPSAEDVDCPRQGDVGETNELPQKRRKLTEQKSVLSDAVAGFRNGEQPEADADSIYSGTLLEELADENASTFAVAAPSRPLAGPCPLRWGSCCSGTEGCHFVFQAINRVLLRHGSDCRFSQAFACEKALEKRKFIRQVMRTELPTSALSSDSESDAEQPETKSSKRGPNKKGSNEDEAAHLPCIFEDITEMGKKVAACWQHGKQCPVPTVDFLVLGTSCKDLSKANPKQDKMALTKTATKGQSAQTFNGYLVSWTAIFAWFCFLLVCRSCL